MSSALTILSKMGDPRDIVYGEAEAANLRFIAAYAALVWLAPNTQELTGYDHGNRSVGDKLAAWRVQPLVFYATAVLLVLGLLGIHQHSEFIYFRF